MKKRKQSAALALFGDKNKRRRCAHFDFCKFDSLLLILIITNITVTPRDFVDFFANFKDFEKVDLCS